MLHRQPLHWSLLLPLLLQLPLLQLLRQPNLFHPVSEQVQRTATALATKVWTSGAPCAQLFAGRNVATAEEVNYAIAMQWVTIDGDRIAPGAADRRAVDRPIEVQTAIWSPGGQLDWWVKDRREWWGRARGVQGRQRWVRAVDLRPASGSQP
jgi:hypothetical protein